MSPRLKIKFRERASEINYSLHRLEFSDRFSHHPRISLAWKTNNLSLCAFSRYDAWYAFFVWPCRSSKDTWTVAPCRIPTSDGSSANSSVCTPYRNPDKILWVGNSRSKARFLLSQEKRSSQDSVASIASAVPNELVVSWISTVFFLEQSSIVIYFFISKEQI